MQNFLCVIRTKNIIFLAKNLNKNLNVSVFAYFQWKKYDGNNDVFRCQDQKQDQYPHSTINSLIIIIRVLDFIN